MKDVIQILEIIFNSIIQLWPYLIITIPISVAVHLSGAAKYINRVMRKSPGLSILLATLVGALSPFCSCGVIPIVASMLIGGVPLAPIMSFWVASPSMDPEIFFLSVATLGWNLAIWRFVSTLLLSVGAGYLTLVLVKKNWFGENILSVETVPMIRKVSAIISENYNAVFQFVKSILVEIRKNIRLRCCPSNYLEFSEFKLSGKYAPGEINYRKNSTNDRERNRQSCSCNSENTVIITKQNSCGRETDKKTFMRKVIDETLSASLLVLKFMTLAFLIKALITLYIPDAIIINLVGSKNIFSVLISTIIGIPFYTSNITALPMIGALIEQGMDKGAALAFLIAGPITTLPAMGAVWGLTNKKVFLIYLLIPLLGAIIFGYLFNFIYSL